MNNLGKKMLKMILFLFGLLLFAYACSSSQSTSENGEEVYVFDNVPKDSTIEVTESGEYPTTSSAYYVVQIGAYTSKEKADSFVESSREKIKSSIIITFSENLNLYLVQLSPFYKSKKEAELVRDELKKDPDFSDAWIVTVNK